MSRYYIAPETAATVASKSASGGNSPALTPRCKTFRRPDRLGSKLGEIQEIVIVGLGFVTRDVPGEVEQIPSLEASRRRFEQAPRVSWGDLQQFQRAFAHPLQHWGLRFFVPMHINHPLSD
jgi:hypothetical protein